MALKDFFSKSKTKKKESIQIESGRLYDYTDKDSRETTVQYLYLYAKTQREAQVNKWIKYNDYYEGKHITQEEIQTFCRDNNLPFIPAVVQDPYIHVESQIISDVPDFEFTGRDDDQDSQKAKQREYVVRYVAENNKLSNMNTENERQLNKLGNAFWKVCWDGTKSGPGWSGDISIINPDPSNIFPDPAAIELDDCEFIDYVYRMHKIKVGRVFANELKALDMTINDIAADGNFSDTEIFDSSTYDVTNDTVQIIEHWFRQPMSGKETMTYYDDKGKAIKDTVEWESGDIACSIMINDMEIKYIPKYWRKTGKQCKLYPFVKYCKIPVNKSFWDKSELDPIIELVDAADREMSMMLLNDSFNANDIILEDEDAQSDNTTWENVPGARWKVKAGKSVTRLGGLSNLNGGLKDTITYIRQLIKETVGNFDVNQGGAPPTNVNTLGGLVELRQQGEKRQNLKKADRTAGFEQLYELIDWTALEFYDDDRVIFLGADGKQAPQQPQQQPQQTLPQGQDINSMLMQQQQPNMDRSQGNVVFKFNSDNIKIKDQQTGDSYYPRIDAKVNVGDGIQHSKALTLSAIETISKMAITPENYKIVDAMLDVMDLPQSKDIKQYLEDYFNNLAQTAGQPKQQPQDVSINFRDMPADAQQQLLQQKLGIQTQMEAPLEQQADAQMNGVQLQPLSMPNPEQAQQFYSDLFSKMSPQELQYLSENPQELEKFIQSMGGNSNASQETGTQNLQGQINA